MIATLGPEGTFSEEAALNYLDSLDLEEEISFLDNIKEIFEFVDRGKGEGIVPVENMVDGSVGETLDLLYKKEVYITNEIVLPITLCLASKSKKFDTVVSHPKALGQSLDYIREKGLKMKEETSTAKAMELVKDNDNLAAIGSKLAAKKYGLNIIEEGISNKNNNVTRFLVLGKNKRKEGDKTSIAIHPNKDRPGLLYDLLGCFASRNINLTKIESRPTKSNLGEYIFYLDLEGSLENGQVKEAFEEVKEMAKIRVFGSYFKIHLNNK